MISPEQREAAYAVVGMMLSECSVDRGTFDGEFEVTGHGYVQGHFFNVPAMYHTRYGTWVGNLNLYLHCVPALGWREGARIRVRDVTRVEIERNAHGVPVLDIYAEYAVVDTDNPAKLLDPYMYPPCKAGDDTIGGRYCERG